MKKYLAIFSALMLMTSFSSCGNTQENSSKPSDSVSVSATEEVTTEKATIAETVTEKPTEKEIILDSEWECDYLTIAKCSEWDEQINKENDGISVFWHDCKISLFLDESISQKLSEEDLKEWYSDLQYDDYKILDTFEKNGQAYLMMGHENSGSRDLKFSTGAVSGTIDYSVEDEEIVMQMIDSIEFKENIIAQDDTENEEYIVGSVSFVLPKNCIEEEMEVSKGECFDYTFPDNSSLTVKKSPDYPGLSTNYDDETIEEVLEVLLSSTFDDMSAVFDVGDFEIQRVPETTEVNGHFALKQKAVAYDVFRYSIYDFVCGDNIYSFCFSDSKGLDAYDMQDEIIKSISFE